MGKMCSLDVCRRPTCKLPATDTSPIGAADVTFPTMGGNANSDPFFLGG